MTELFLIATALLGATTPVIARDVRPAASSETRAGSSPDQSVPTRAAQRYCTVYDVTGSRIPIKTCKTRDEWLKDGFDPLAKN